MQQSPPRSHDKQVLSQNSQIQEKIKKYEQSLRPGSNLVSEHEMKSTFARQIDNFYCDFSLTKDDQLKIVITSQLDASVYELQLSKEQKKAHQELNFFQSMQEIYEYIMDNTAQNARREEKKLINIKQNGGIELVVVSSIGKKQRHRSIVLQTVKVQEKREEYLEKVIKKISKNVIELRVSFEQLKAKHTLFQKQNNELLQKLNSYGHRYLWKVAKSDPHFDKFKYSDNKITKTVDNTSYFNIISQTAINKSGTSYFDVKILSTAKKNIMIGIGSKFIKGIPNAYTHPDFIGFYLFGETYLWQNNNQRDLQIKNCLIQNGITITTTINMDLGYINWEICGVRVAYAVIPLQLKAKALFPVVTMINVNDVIQQI